MKTKDQTQLIKACIQGDLQAQKTLYETYYSKMFHVCLRYSKNEEDAKDILQEGYTKVFQSLKKYQNQGSLNAWVYRIMTNVAIDHYHKRKKYQNIEVQEYELYHLSEQYNSTDEVLNHLQYEDMLKLLRRLSPAYQTVFNLFAIEGYSHKEIAKKLNIKEGTSKSNLAKARKALQKKLEELVCEEEAVYA